MPNLIDQIAVLASDPSLADDERRLAIYRLKTRALIDVIRNGALPELPLLNRDYTHKGHQYRIIHVEAGPQDQLMFDVVINGCIQQVNIINPPLLPREVTGDERRDMLTAVAEMLEGIGV